MTFLDIVLAGVVFGTVLGGFARGFARTALGMISMILGIVLGFWFYGVPGAFFGELLRSEMAAKVLGFLSIYFVVVGAGAVLGWLIAKAFKFTGLSWLDRTLGGAVGAFKGAIFVIAIVAVLLAFSPKQPPEWIARSKVVPYASDAAGVLAEIAPASIKETYAATREVLEQVWKQDIQKRLEKQGFDEKLGKLAPRREE